MSLFLDFTQEDIDRGKVVKPDFYVVNITEIEMRMSKDGQSQNYFLKGQIEKSMTGGSEEFKGIPTPHWMFNSKAKGFIVSFLKDGFGIEVAPGKRIDFDALQGQKVGVFIGNKDFEGRFVNDLQHKYRQVMPIGATA